MRRDSKLHLQPYVIQTRSGRQDISVSETKTSHEATLFCSSRHALLVLSGQHFVSDFVQAEVDQSIKVQGSQKTLNVHGVLTTDQKKKKLVEH